MAIHLDGLQAILLERCGSEDLLFPCIRDLAANGVDLSRFTDTENVHLRQAATEFLAAWFKKVGMPMEICLSWLLGYCTDLLAGISSSTLSQIRHSTKSTCKYIYGQNVAFACGCENNLFKAQCRQDCPVYVAIQAKAHAPQENQQPDITPSQEYEEPPQEIPAAPPKEKPILKRDLYLEEFERAMKFAIEQRKLGVSRKIIAKLLIDNGYKTRTGKTWNYHTLVHELAVYDAKNTQD